MKIFIEKTKQEKELSFSGSCRALLEELGVNSEEVLVVRNKELISLDDFVDDDDEVRLLSVISGG